MARAGNNAPGPDRDAWAEHAARLESIATDLRLKRDGLLADLLPLQDRLAEVAEEAHSLLPPNALRSFDAVPHPGEPAPRPISGIEPDLALVDWLKVFSQNVTWTRRQTRAWAVQAVGPTYLLSITIEHPTPEAMKLRAELEKARDHLLRFVTPVSDL